MSLEQCLDLLGQAADLATREEHRATILLAAKTISDNESRHVGMDAWGERDKAKAETRAQSAFQAVRNSGWTPTRPSEPGSWSPFRKLVHRVSGEVRHVHSVDASELLQSPEGPDWEDQTFSS